MQKGMVPVKNRPDNMSGMPSRILLSGKYICKKLPIPGPDDEALKYNYFMLIGLRQRFIKLILFRNSHILPSMVLL